MLKLDQVILLEVCGVGVPAAIQNLLNVTGMTVLNNFTSSYGPDAVAAMGIAQKINMIPLYFALGLSQGIMPLISYNYAGKNKQRMKETVLFSARLALSFMVIISAGYYLGAGALVSLFMKKSLIVQYGSCFLKGLCLALPFLCMDFLAVGVFQACGQGKKAFIFAVLRKIILEIPALFVWNWVWPMYGLAYAQLTAELVLSAAAVLVVRTMLKD